MDSNSSDNGGYAPAPDMLALAEVYTFLSPPTNTSTEELENTATNSLLVLYDQQAPEDESPSPPAIMLMNTSNAPAFTTPSAGDSSSSNSAENSSLNGLGRSISNQGNDGNRNEMGNNATNNNPRRERGPDVRSGDRCEHCIRNKKGCDGVRPICGRCATRRDKDCRWPSDRLTHSQLKKRDAAGSGSGSGSGSSMTLAPTTVTPAPAA